MKWKSVFFICSLLFIPLLIQAAEKIKGNGNVITKEKKITDFNSIKLNAGCDIFYYQSDSEPSMQITLDENLHPYLNVEVKNRTLSISFKGAKIEEFTRFSININSRWLKEAIINGNGNLAIESDLTGDELVIKSNGNSLVELKNKTALGKLDLNVSGSANMVVNQVETDRLQCTINGSGSITLKEGNAKEASYSITSSGDIHALGVAVPEISCRVTGSGTAEIHPTDNLKATLVGSGHIRYKGPTAIQQKKMGKGTIEEVK